MNSIDFGSVGILQIGNARYGFRPMEVYTEFGHAPILKGEFFPEAFAVSNLEARARKYLAGMNEVARDPEIKNVYFNDPATVVIWGDGSKTIVRCQPGDTYSKETGLALCIAKKYLGNKGNFNEVFKKWIPEETEPVGETEPVEEDEYSFEEDDSFDGIEAVEEACGIRVGDKVRVIHSGAHYGGYTDWLEHFVKDPGDRCKWRSLRDWGDGAIGVVKYIAPHEDGGRFIAYVEIGDQCSMIGLYGLEKVEEG